MTRMLPLFRFNQRARLTSWGVALCTMFIVASFSIAGGLETSMDALTDSFSSEYSLVTMPGVSGLEFFDQSRLSSIGDKAAFGMLCEATLSQGGSTVIVFSVQDPSRVLPESIQAEGNDVLEGRQLSLSGNITLISDGSADVVVAGRFSSSIFSPGWVLASPEVLSVLTAQPLDRASFAITKGLSSDDGSALAASGFSVQPMMGIVEFLESGVKEIRAAATFALVPSAFVIAVLAYSFMGSEISDRRHEIGVIKTIGAGRRRILGYLCAHSLVICVWGGLLGLALGIVLSYAFSTAASSMFTSVFAIEIEEALLVVSFLVTIGAGTLGALVPAVRMTLSSPVKDLREVAPFS